MEFMDEPKKEQIIEFIKHLKSMPESVERECEFFNWKHKYFKNAGTFSPSHGGNCSGHFIQSLEGKLKWDEFTTIDGKRVLLELEQNFNVFVKKIKNIIK
jgi:hypothetical protein